MPAYESIEVTQGSREGSIVVRPLVDIDMSRSPGLLQVMREAHDKRPNTLVIDLSQVGYMDSSGLATLVQGMRTAKQNRTNMVLCGMNDRVKAIFQIARLDQFFTIVNSIDDAMKC